MGRLRYQAIDQGGKVRRGTVVAFHEGDLEDRLRDRGLTLISSKPAKDDGKISKLAGGKIKPRLLVEFYRRFAQTVDMGLPILTGLEENAKVIPSKPLKRVIEDVKGALEDGSTLFDAMGQFPKIFEKLDLGIIRMGEQSGVLPQCLNDLADFLEWKEDLRGTIKRATIYPSFVLLAISGVIGVWVGYVLPQVGSMLLDMGVELPGITKAILTTSEFLQTNWKSLVFGVFALFGTAYLLQKTKRGKLIFHEYLLRVPIIGALAGNIAYARLSRTFATMHRAGMTIPKIFSVLSSSVLGNRHLEAQVALAFHELEMGQSLAESFENAGGFPPLLVGGIRHGEITGSLEESFNRMGTYYDGEVNRAVEVLINAFEPAIMLLLGGVFGVIILSIMLPLYDVLGGLGQAY
jgi:type II secretory pathway component PulF